MRKVALITGASSGIGYALCLEFARARYDIVAIGQNRESLEKLKQECAHVTLYCLQKDLTEPDAVTVICRFLKDNHLQITTLVNGAGFGVWGAFAESSWKDETKLITLSISFYLELTKALIPGMISSQHGEILNIGSVYSFIPVPKQSVYAAGKAFLLSHSLSLRSELEPHHIKVCLSCPGITQTAFRARHDVPDKKSLFSMSAADVAHITFHHFAKNKAIIIPGIYNKVFIGLARLFPVHFMAKVITLINIKRKITTPATYRTLSLRDCNAPLSRKKTTQSDLDAAVKPRHVAGE